MSRSYTCLACRARLLLLDRIGLSRQQLRDISTPTHTYPAPRPENGISSILEENGRRTAVRPDTKDSRVAYNDNQSQEGGKNKIGRYSRRELKPEELLNQLDSKWSTQNSAPEWYKTRPKPRTHYTSSTINRNDTSSLRTRGQQRHHRLDKVPTEIHDIVQRFISRMRVDELEAWLLLQELQALCSRTDRHYNLRGLWNQDFLSCLSPLLWNLSGRWLTSLQPERRDDTCPSPSKVLEVIESLGVGAAGRRLSALWNIARGIFELQTKANFASAQREHEGVEELMEIWYGGIYAKLSSQVSLDSQETKLGQQQTTPNHILTPKDLDWSFLPTVEVLMSRRTERQIQMGLEDMLELLFPTLPIASRVSDSGKPRAELASSALLTLDILRKPRVASDDIKSELGSYIKHEKFITLLEGILKTVPTPTPLALINKIRTSQDTELSQAYRDACARIGLDVSASLAAKDDDNTRKHNHSQFEKIKGAIDHAESTSSQSTINSPRRPRSNLSEEERRAFVNDFTTNSIRRLGRATEKQDLYLVEKVRREVSVFAGSQGNDPAVIPLELYEHLMMAFFSLRNLKAAMEIWAQISRSGYKPNVRTYTMMMRGAIGSRDLSGMQTFWAKMQQASILPDDHAWSVRIFGLIKMNHVRAGLQALNDMGNDWIAAARREAERGASESQRHSQAVRDMPTAELVKKYSGAINGVARPTVVIVNSAVSALALVADNEIPKVLSWGRVFGITPNLTTYNGLLNVAMRHSAPEEALNILHRMQEQGIEPDSTTWTVLLTALFRSGFLDGLDAAGQQEKILELLNTLEAQGRNNPGVDHKGYALIIDRLLKQYDNSSAAEAVLKRMLDSGRKPTAHIYTILMTSYFQKQPQPDLTAIESLWRRITSENNGFGASLDSVFFDRMIEGYAKFHQVVGIRPMLGFLERMTQGGKWPSWTALEQVARALAERGEWEHLRSIVLDVRGRLESSRGAFQHAGQRDFWNFVLSTGLLKDEGLSRPQQMLPGQRRPSPLTVSAHGDGSLRTQ